jgi:serine/threonine-protein kinase
LPEEVTETTLIDVNEESKPALVWPWIALIVALIITATVLIFALVTKTAPAPSPTPSATVSPSPTPTATATATPTTPSDVVVLSSEVLGLNKDEVFVALTAKGLLVNLVEGTALQTGDPKINTIYEALPLGTMPSGSTINLTFYTETAPPVEPVG